MDGQVAERMTEFSSLRALLCRHLHRLHDRPNTDPQLTRRLAEATSVLLDVESLNFKLSSK